jgi:hypothetical protein
MAFCLSSKRYDLCANVAISHPLFLICSLCDGLQLGVGLIVGMNVTGETANASHEEQDSVDFCSACIENHVQGSHPRNVHKKFIVKKSKGTDATWSAVDETCFKDKVKIRQTATSECCHVVKVCCWSTEFFQLHSPTIAVPFFSFPHLPSFPFFPPSLMLYVLI